MIARCARCQGTFTTDRFGVQTCPHCGSELHLADPGAPAASPPPPPPAGATPPAPPPGPTPPAWGAPPPPPDTFGASPQGTPGGYAPPPAGWIPPPPVPPPGGRAAAPPEGQLDSPFGERQRRGFLPAFFETFKLVAIQPADFFRRVRPDRTGSAILFGVVAATFGTLMQALYSFLTMSATVGMMQQMAEKMPAEQAKVLSMISGLAGRLQLAEVILAPVFWFIFIYVWAAVLHLVLVLLKATPRGFDATLTVVGYATALMMLSAVPMCGSLVALVWLLVVAIVGLGEAQRCGPGKAAAAVFAPVILVCVCCCGVLGLSAGGLAQIFKAGLEAAQGQSQSL
jgi:hypothetical protein